MDKIPREILDMILENLPKYKFPNTERFRTLTLKSKRSILNARLVWGHFRHQQPLRGLFVRVLEDSVFALSCLLKDHHIPDLEKVVESEYAADITTISFCPYGLPIPEGTRPEQLDFRAAALALRESLGRLTNLRHLRYYTLDANRALAWAIDGSRQHYVWEDYLTEDSRLDREGLLVYESSGTRATRYLQWLEFWFRHSKLESFTMPLLGNTSESTALEAPIYINDDYVFNGWKNTLRRMSLNMDISTRIAVPLESGINLDDLMELEFLEIAVTTKQDEDGERWRVQRLMWSTDREPLPKLAELRLMATPRIQICQDNLLVAIVHLSGLRRIALAHIVLVENAWHNLLEALQSSHLDAVWLLNPLILLNPLNPGNIMKFKRYERKDADPKVAKDFRIVHTPYPWGDTVDRDNGDGFGYEYPGFRVFEEMDEATAATTAIRT